MKRRSQSNSNVLRTGTVVVKRKPKEKSMCKRKNLIKKMIEAFEAWGRRVGWVRYWKGWGAVEWPCDRTRWVKLRYIYRTMCVHTVLCQPLGPSRGQLQLPSGATLMQPCGIKTVGAMVTSHKTKWDRSMSYSERTCHGLRQPNRVTTTCDDHINRSSDHSYRFRCNDEDAPHQHIKAMNSHGFLVFTGSVHL